VVINKVKAFIEDKRDLLASTDMLQVGAEVSDQMQNFVPERLILRAKQELGFGPGNGEAELISLM
jgi:hypothetical protein